MSKSFLFISTVNLTTNPRIVKEIKLADSMGYDVTFIGFKLGNWSDELDIEFQKEMPSVKLVYLDATRKSFIPWLISTCIEKVAKGVNKIFPQGLKLAAFASSKRSVLLQWQLKNAVVSDQHFNMIVAHTLGSLYPAYRYAKRTASKFAFDVEDFHPWESIKGNGYYEMKRRETIMKQILPHAFYVSAAAPLIAKQVNILVPVVSSVTVYNSFPKQEFAPPADIRSEKIKLVWFSQNINAGRGLELIMRVWRSLENNFELTLIGKPDNQFYEQHIQGHKGVILLPPMKQSELHKLLSQFDIGLAFDIDAEDDNRKLVITNKILAYYQAGLYIIATNTPAQNQFITNHVGHGILTDQASEAVLKVLLTIPEKITEIRKSAAIRFREASEFNWENESGLLLKIWNSLN